MLSCRACNGVVGRWEEYCPRCGSPVVPNPLNVPDTTIVAGELVLLIRWRTVYGIPVGRVVRREAIRDSA
ncbi:MAG: hypothetical protein KGL39_54875 [Patescibacteria group bacterium]|nr:hypothetical protein [Patescibacteria group bacterium]